MASYAEDCSKRRIQEFIFRNFAYIFESITSSRHRHDNNKDPHFRKQKKDGVARRRSSSSSSSAWCGVCVETQRHRQKYVIRSTFRMYIYYILYTYVHKVCTCMYVERKTVERSYVELEQSEQ